MKRRTFIKSVAAVAATTPFVSLVHGCGSSAPSLHIPAVNSKVTVSKLDLPDLATPNSYVKLYVNDHANPIILFQREGKGMAAVLSTCAHSGCEVRKTRAKFECPCHGSEYDVNGNVLKGPAAEALENYRVVEFADRIEIHLEQL
jgi:cytochrome b6-f complex iron-sulfur subunit